MAWSPSTFWNWRVALNEQFRIAVHDDTVFLRNLRLHLESAKGSGQNVLDRLKAEYAFLSAGRLQEILSDLEGGPVIQVQDLAGYVQWQMTNTQSRLSRNPADVFEDLVFQPPEYSALQKRPAARAVGGGHAALRASNTVAPPTANRCDLCDFAPRAAGIG